MRTQLRASEPRPSYTRASFRESISAGASTRRQIHAIRAYRRTISAPECCYQRLMPDTRLRCRSRHLSPLLLLATFIYLRADMHADAHIV
jgi:hypothetical protein